MGGGSCASPVSLAVAVVLTSSTGSRSLSRGLVVLAVAGVFAGAVVVVGGEEEEEGGEG